MRGFRAFVLAFLAVALTATAALAHAALDHAVPGVGATVSAPPGDLELAFTENVVPAFSGVEIATVEGVAVATGKPAVDPATPKVLRVRIEGALKPGVYIVRWHVVSVDTHRSSGTYKFTVAP